MSEGLSINRDSRRLTLSSDLRCLMESICLPLTGITKGPQSAGAALIVNLSRLFLLTPACKQGLIAAFCILIVSLLAVISSNVIFLCRSIQCASFHFSEISFQDESYSVFLGCSLAVSKGFLLLIEYPDMKK